MRFNRHVIADRVMYHTYCNDPCYYLSSEGINILKSSGWHPDKNPWVDNHVEDILVQKYFLKCIRCPTNEYQVQQLNFLK